MASDNLINVIAGLVKRDGRIAKEADQKVKAKFKAEKEKKDDEEEDDEDEDPVGDPAPAGKDDATEPEPEEEPADAGGEGKPDNKPTGPDPVLVAQIAAIIKAEIEAEDKAKKEKEVKLSGKKEKIDTTPTMKQEGTRMNFREAVRKSITGSPMAEGYESHVLEILNDESIDGPLGYEPFFENGKLYVMKGQEGSAKKALKNSREVSKLPKIVGEELEPEEYLAMESVSVDGRLRGFKEALKRLTYEKIQQMKEKEAAKAKTKKVEVDEIKLTDEESELQKKYKEFYQKMLDKFGVKSPGEMDDDKKKEFFNAIEKGWKEGEGPVKEEFEDFEEFLVNMIAVDEKKMTAQAKKKSALYKRSPAGKKAIAKYLKKSKRPGYKVDKNLAKSMKKSAKKMSFEPEDGEQIEETRTPVSVDARRKGFKEALSRLTYEKLRKLHDKQKAEEIRRSEERWSSESVEEMGGKKKIGIDESEANDKRNAAINVGIGLRTYLKKDKWFNIDLEKIRDILLKGKLPQVKDMPDDDKSKKVILKLMKNNMKNKFAKRYKGYSSAFDTWITEESELTESTTTDKKNTFTMAPFEDLRSVADAALKIMTRQPQEVKEEEKEEVTKENQPQQLTEQIV